MGRGHLLVAHLLFGTRDHLPSQNSERPIWRKQIVLHCGNVRGIQGQCASAHYEHTLRVREIAWPDI